MAPIAGKPFLEYLLLHLRQGGIRDIVLCTGYYGHCIEEYFGSGDQWGLRLQYSREEKPLGTAGALKRARPLMEQDQFFVLNGDSCFGVSFLELLRYHEQRQAIVTVALAFVENTQRFGFVEINAAGAIVRFSEKAERRSGWINGGIYVIRRHLVERIPEERAVSLEHEIFPQLVGHGFYGLPVQAPFWDIGTPEAYAKLQAESDHLISIVNKERS